jgi:hypothetical protein
VYLYSPRIVVDAIRTVVDDVRRDRPAAGTPR